MSWNANYEYIKMSSQHQPQHNNNSNRIIKNDENMTEIATNNNNDDQSSPISQRMPQNTPSAKQSFSENSYSFVQETRSSPNIHHDLSRNHSTSMIDSNHINNSG
eukprot:332439_1